MYGSVGGSVGIARVRQKKGSTLKQVQVVQIENWLTVQVSRVVVGGRVVVVVVVGGRVVVIFLSFFFPFLSVLGFLVAFGSFGSLVFFLSFFFFFASSGALFTLPKTTGKMRKIEDWKFPKLTFGKNHLFIQNKGYVIFILKYHPHAPYLSYVFEQSQT